MRSLLVSAVEQAKQAEGAQDGSTFGWFQQFLTPGWENNRSSDSALMTVLENLVKNVYNISSDRPPSIDDFPFGQAEKSILSSWSYLASLTSNTIVDRVILDVFEGQLITCVVITGFILVFLIREWVVQQQPLVNLENLGNVQQQLREAADRVQADNERLRRQQELLEQARRRLAELQNETEGFAEAVEGGERIGRMEFVGWEALEELIDQATEHMRKGGENEHARFLSCAAVVTRQIRAAGATGEGLDDFTDKVYGKLASFSEEERREWEAVLVSEIEKSGKARRRRKDDDFESRNEEQEQDESPADGPSASTRRPPMPERDFSSRATQIQRLLAEAEDVYERTNNTIDQGNASPRSTQAEPPTESASTVSAPSTESWQEVSPPSDSTASEPEAKPAKNFDPMPITNAGPDAKINIKRSSKGKAKDVTTPKIEEKMLNVDEELSKLNDEVAKEGEDRGRKDSDSSAEDSQPNEQGQDSQEDNPFHPEGPPPERRDSESFGNRVASVFREEFGLDEAEELNYLRQAGIGSDGETDRSERQDSPQPQPDDRPPTYLQRVADWFWGDITTANAPEPVPTANEERERNEGTDSVQVAPFVPVQNGQPVAAAPADETAPAPAPADAGTEQPQNDPEVVAAAQQAGLDPEAVEDAEDLEGIFELIGLQGPIIGLFQTSAFCMALVACTILGAVVVPYLGGKMVLSFIANPVYFLFQMPLQVASAVADFVIDVTLIFGGYGAMLLGHALDFALSAVQTWAPALGSVTYPEKLIKYATMVAERAVFRLSAMFTMSNPAPAEGVALEWAFLGWSVHAHASLRTVQDEVNAVLSYTGNGVTWLIETLSAGSFMALWEQISTAMGRLPELPERLLVGATLLQQHLQPLLDFIVVLSKGALTFSTPTISMDPTLVYWNSTDRALAIITGYAALAALAAIYVAVDTPITTSESGRKTEKLIRDTLRQAGGVLKVILIISIEMLVFPLYCGMLLDFAFLPLFQNASVASRWAFAGRRPYMFCFVHWFVGTCYMFHFALFVGMCRKILRKGVLWFIRDPDDPTFHPVRDVLERNVATQLRKIAFSALVYGALVILCLGGVIWTIGHVFSGIFPIHWIFTEPVLEFPLDLLLYNFVTPLVIRLFKPSDTVHVMYAWWLRRCARALRLSHFLFDDRRKDEEGRYVHDTWKGFLMRRKLHIDASAEDEAHTTPEDSEESNVHFKNDGKYVLTPCNDQYRPPKPGEAFLHVDENDVYITDKDGKKNDHFCKVYVPPLFRLRISLFMVCLWMFSAFTGLCSTLVPLLFGRYLLAITLPEGIRVNDIYAYSIGAYLLGGVMFVILKAKPATSYLQKKASLVDVKSWAAPLKRFSAKVLKCAYVYGYLGVALPTIFALLLQFYLILPLHTWAVSAANSSFNVGQSDNSTTILGNVTDSAGLFPLPPQEREMPSMVEHTFHILQDYALGLLYVRIASRMVIAAPASRAAEAFRRITADGYLNPNIRLATRFFVLPVTLLSAFVFTAPPIIAKIAINVLNIFGPGDLLDAAAQTQIYRYSYPTAAGAVMLVLGTAGLGKATSRWRARIRDEVYLVGERLHNFGEKKPPAGSKSVVRKER